MGQEFPPAIPMPDCLPGLVQGLPLEGFERSFKLIPGGLLTDRYLIGLSRKSISASRLMDICGRLGMPEAAKGDLDSRFATADSIHFGYEGSARGARYKVYLEFWQELNRVFAMPGSREPVLLHLAYKWDTWAGGEHGLGRYVCHPELTLAKIATRISEIHSCSKIPAVHDLVGAVLDRVGDEGSVPMYLEVREEGSSRISYDLNLYDAELDLAYLEPRLLKVAGSFGIPEESFDLFFRPLRGACLGHLAGGVDRNGKDFLTVYYRVDEQPT